ncbi:hypothetical protein R2F25_20260 [Streptomyces sp. UP1A-1]|nr:hypothetical protein [Streptomyces sp. UP1A-1]
MAHPAVAGPGRSGRARPAGRERARPDGSGASPWQTLVLLRGVALIGGLGLAFLLDDPARHLTTPVPVRRPLRQALRVALVAPFAALWWTAVLRVAPAASRPPSR